MEKEAKRYQRSIEALKISEPAGLEQSVLSFIERKEAQRRRFTKRLISAAAVLLVIVSTIIIVPQNSSKEMDYADKLVALVEANMLFPEEAETDKEEIIYEDELLIIYLK